MISTTPSSRKQGFLCYGNDALTKRSPPEIQMVIILKGVESFQDNNFMKSVSSHFVRAVFINQPEHCCELYLNNLSDFLKLSQVEEENECARLIPMTLFLILTTNSSTVLQGNTIPKYCT